MKNIILLLALAGSLTHCKDTPKQDVNTTPSPTAQTSADEDPDGLKQIKGLLVQNGGRTGFIDYKKNTMYEITDQTNTIDKAYNQAAAPCAYMSETVYAVLTGKFTRTGSTGFHAS